MSKWTKLRDRIIDRIFAWLGIEESEERRAESEDEPSPAEPAPEPQHEEQAPSVLPVVIDWRFGGFNGAKAVEDPNTQICDLRMDKDGLSYRWAKGGCENFGASDRGDYSHTLACAFYWDGDKWIGGKFDWISTLRTSRSFTNIYEGYGGWNAAAFFDAPKRAYCIASADGRKRTNLLETN